jgi:hypothetical protein
MTEDQRKRSKHKNRFLRLWRRLYQLDKFLRVKDSQLGDVPVDRITDPSGQ